MWEPFLQENLSSFSIQKFTFTFAATDKQTDIHNGNTPSSGPTVQGVNNIVHRRQGEFEM